MQVSWIDPEDIAALAESLRPGSTPAPAKPDPAELPAPPAEPLVSDEPVPPSPAAQTVSAPDLAAFREKLQSIREKAIRAGLMSSPPAEPAPQPAASAEPAPVAAPEPEVVTSHPAPEPEPDMPAAAELAQPEVIESINSPQEAEAAAPEWDAQPETVADLSPAYTAEPAPEAATLPDFQAPSAEEAPVVEESWQENVAAFPMSADAGVVADPVPPEPVSWNEPVAPTHFDAAPSLEAPQDWQAFSEPAELLVSPGASVKERLEAYARWAEQTWGPAELLIVDEFGDLLWGPPRRSGLVLSTMMAWNAAIRASAQAASGIGQIRQQLLPAGESLSLIPCPTRLGMLQIALVKQQTPLEAETGSLRATLAGVMNLL